MASGAQTVQNCPRRARFEPAPVFMRLVHRSPAAFHLLSVFDVLREFGEATSSKTRENLVSYVCSWSVYFEFEWSFAFLVGLLPSLVSRPSFTFATYMERNRNNRGGPVGWSKAVGCHDRRLPRFGASEGS